MNTDDRAPVGQWLANVIPFCLALYSFTIPWMSTYYWWQDVKTHDSFPRAVLWSPLVGFFKSTHWPYYAFYEGKEQPLDDNRWTSMNERQQQSIRSFFAAYKYLQSINRIGKALPTTKDPVSDVGHIDSLATSCLERASECDLHVLNQLHNGWGDAVGQYLIPGMRKLKSGLGPDGDRVDLTRSEALFGRFDSWLHSNWNQIGEKSGGTLVQ